MPSEATGKTYTARCYCGASRLTLSAAPLTAAYCHCADCRRWTGAPVGAFVAFEATALQTDLGPGVSHSPGVARWNCPKCGSPLAATFDYLPGQVYVPIGILDQAAEIAPEHHCHSQSALPWLHIHDGLPHDAGSARERLNAANKDPSE